MSATHDPWAVPEADFPRDGLVGDWLRFATRYAVLAPSSHNSQPWLFRVIGGTLELFADRTRALPVTDPHDRELTISCGAALFHLRVALQHFGHPAHVKILPDRRHPDLLARVQLDAEEIPEFDPSFEALFEAIPNRRTYRRSFESGEVFPVLVDEFERDAKREGVVFVPLVDQRLRYQVAELVAEADRRQFADAGFCRELAAWMHWNRTRSRDGMPGYALGTGELGSVVAPLAVRTFDMGEGRAAKDRELADHSPLLAVIATPHDTPADWLAAGQALARVLLRGTANGVGASYLNQPLEVSDLRTILAATVGTTFAPQLVLRMGLLPPEVLRPTPRRPAEDVLTGPSLAPGAIH
jgi:nitroreductase